MKLFVVFFISILAVILGTTPLVAESVKLEADYWMPYNGDGVSETGYMLDIAKSVFKAAGYDIVFKKVPWNRAIADGKAGTCDGIVGTTVEDAKGFAFPTEEQGIGSMEFYTTTGSGWKYSGPASLTGIIFGVISDYSYSPRLDTYIKANPKAIYIQHGDDPLKTNLNMLLEKRFAAVIDDTNVLKYMVNKMGISDKVVSAGHEPPTFKLYIAFSPQNPHSKDFSKILSDGMVRLRKSGELKQILSLYGLTDWKE